MLEIRGIDVSSWNGQIDWEQVKASGIDFAIIRATAAANIDKAFAANTAAALDAGVDCGLYTYSYATTPQQAVAEAKAVLAAAKPYDLVYPIVYDIEDKIQEGLSNAQRTQLVHSFCQEILAAGYKTAVYANLSWLTSKFDLPSLAQYDKWVAQWGSACTFKQPYTLWQNSNVGRVPGIAGDVDLNFCYKDYHAVCGPVPVLPLAPVPKPVPPTGGQAPQLVAGAKAGLVAAPLFTTAVAKLRSNVLTGSYWLYDGQVINGRVRITNSLQNVGRTPIGSYVTGFVAVSSLR